MAASQSTLEILIKAQADQALATFQELQSAVNALTGQLQSAASVNPTAALSAGGSAATTVLRDIAGAADGITASTKKAVAEAGGLSEALKFGGAVVGVGFLAQGIHGIGEKIRETIAEGVRFNAEMERAAIGIAGSLKSVDAGLPFERAREVGGIALDKLREKANALGLDFMALVETYSINLPTMYHAGVKELQQQVDLMVLLNQVGQSKGISGFQLQRDLTDLINGAASRTMLGRELEPLGINDEAIKRWKEAGTFVQEMTTRLSAYKEAGEAAANTFTAAAQRLANELHQLAGEATKPIFEALRGGINSLVASLATPALANTITSLSGALAKLGGAGLGLTNFAINNASALLTLAQAIAAVSAAWGAAALVTKLGGLAMITDTVLVALGAGFTVFNATFAAATEAVAGFFAALGPVGWTVLGLAAGGIAVSKAFSLYAEAEKEATKEAENFRKKTTELRLELDRLGTRPDAEKFVSQEEAKIAALKRAAAALRELEAEREATEARGVSDPMGDRPAPNLAGASAQIQLQAIQQEITLRQGILDKAKNLTDAELDRQRVSEELKNLLKAQDQILADMVGRLPAFVAGLKTAIAELREAQALAGMNAGQKVDYLQKDQASRYAYLSVEAAKIRDLRGESAKWFDPKITDESSLIRVSEQVEKIKGELKSVGGTLTDDVAKALGNYEAGVEKTKARLKEIASATQQRDQEKERQANSLGDLQNRDAYNRALLAGNNALAQRIKVEAEAIDLEKKYAAANKPISHEEALRQARDAIAVQGLNAKSRAADAYARSLEKQSDAQRAALIEELRAQRSAVQGDPFLSTEQKMAAILPLLAKERIALLENIKVWEKYNAVHAGSGNALTQAQINKNIKQIADANRELTKLSNLGKTSTFGGGVNASMVNYMNSLGTAAENTAKILQTTLHTALQGIGNTITGLIFQTTNWKQAVGQTIQSIVSGFLSLGAQMLEHYILSKVLRKQSDADAETSGATQTSALGTSAVLNSITSYGVAAAVGIAAVLAAIALAKGFSSGGHTGYGPSSEIAGVVHRREVVWSEQDVNRWGGPAVVDYMRSVNPNARTAGISPATGGRPLAPTHSSSGRRERGDRAQVNVAVLRDGHELRQWQETAQGQRHLVSLVRRNRLNIGIRT